MTIPPALIRITLVCIGVYVAICALAWVLQRRLLYFPDQSPVAPEGRMQDLTLRTSDGVAIKATWWPGPREVALVLFHGNAGNRGHRFDWMRPFLSLGWGVLLVDYRGYGGSEGYPSEDGLRRDAEAAVAWMRAEHPAKRLVYLGESLGCSVALACAAQFKPAGLVLQSGAIDLAAVAGNHYPILPIGLILSDRFDARDLIGRLDVPLLSIHGSDDTIIPPRFGREIFDAFAGPKEWYLVPGAGHNDLVDVGGLTYYERVHRFLESLK